MIKKYMGVSLLALSLVAVGCSSNKDDDDTGTTTEGTTTEGTTTEGTTTEGTTTEGTTTEGTTTEGTTTEGTTTEGTTTEGTTTEGTTTEGTTTEGTTGGGTTTGGAGYSADSMMGILAANENLSAAKAALEADGTLPQALDTFDKTWSVFIPNNDAMANVTTADFAFFKDHIYSNGLLEADLSGMVGTELSMTSNKKVTVTQKDDGTLQIGGVDIIGEGVSGENGIVFVIDGTL